jgi:deaminated glutathione amidase
MKSYLAAAIQMTSLPDLHHNLTQAEELIDLATRRGAELVSLPENFAFLGDEDVKVQQADEIATQSEKFLKTVAQRYQVTVLGGGFPVPAPNGKLYSTPGLAQWRGTCALRKGSSIRCRFAGRQYLLRV